MDRGTTRVAMTCAGIKKASVVIVLVSILVGGASQALAQDWPQWRGPNRDGKVSGYAAPQEWPAELTQKWKVAVGSGASTPALVGDRLYVCTRKGDEQLTMCLKAADGEEVWRDSYPAPQVTGGARRHPGPRSSPAVAGGQVVTLGVGGVVSCYDVAAGKLLWRKDPFPNVVPDFFAGVSPIIVDGMAIVHVGGKGTGAIIAYSLSEGDEKWRWPGAAPEYSSPVLLTAGGTKQIVTLTDKGLVGLAAADGKLFWTVSYPPARRSNNVATPVIDGQTVIYSAAGRGCHAVKIEKSGGDFVAKPLWDNPDIGTRFSTPVLKNGMLFGISDSGKPFCINAATGKSAWVEETARGQMGFAGIVDAGSTLLVLPNDSQLIVLKPDATKFSQIRSYKVSDVQTYAHPVVSGNRIFVKDQESLALWTVR